MSFHSRAKFGFGKRRKRLGIFVALPVEMSEDIKAFTKHLARGFRSVKVEAQIGDTSWKTSIFPSKEREAYILPIKKSVRTAEDIGAASVVTVDLRIPT